MNVYEFSFRLPAIGLFLMIGTQIYAQSPTSMSITFEQAWKITENNSHLLKEVGYEKQEKSQDLKTAKALKLPTISLAANYTLMQKDITLNLTPIRDAIAPLYKYGKFTGVPNTDAATSSTMPVLSDSLSTVAMQTTGLSNLESADWNPVIQKKYFGNVAATLSWPIFTGGKIQIANRVAKIEENETDIVMKQKKNSLMSELAERYFGLCLARQAVIVRKNVLSGMSRHLNDAEKMEQQGLIAKADVLHARVFYAQAQREYSKAIRQVEILSEALDNTLSIDQHTMITPTSDLFYLDSLESIDVFQNQARQNNPLLQQIDIKKELSIQNEKNERSNLLPTIALEGMYNVVHHDLSTYTPDWIGGIGLKWTLFDGNSRSSKIKAAQFKTKQVEEIKEKTNEDISTLVGKLYHELQINREQLKELNSDADYAVEYLRVREKSFREQMTNETEVVDAHLSLSNIRMQQLEAIYEYDKTLAMLLEIVGMPEKIFEYKNSPQSHTQHLSDGEE